MSTARVSVEQAATFGWSRYMGPTGTMIGMHTLRCVRAIKDFRRSSGSPTENVVAAARKAIWEK